MMSKDVSIFLPMLVVVAVTIVAFARMFLARLKSIQKREVPLKYYTAFQGGSEPEEVAVAVRHYLNVFESPVLFYAGCLTAYVIDAASGVAIAAAWWYAVARVVQSTIHLTTNNVRFRALAFVASWLGLIVLWAAVAAAIIART